MSPRTSIIVTPIYAKPKDFPASELNKLLKELKNYLIKDAGPMLKKDLEATVKNWRGKPDFTMRYSEPYNGARMQIDLFPTGKNTVKWQRVSTGTGPRQIVPRKGTTMVFPSYYTPKTTPGGKYGGPGRRYGPTKYRRIIKKHEIKPRKFTEIIKNKREKQIVGDIQKVVRKVGRL